VAPSYCGSPFLHYWCRSFTSAQIVLEADCGKVSVQLGAAGAILSYCLCTCCSWQHLRLLPNSKPLHGNVYQPILCYGAACLHCTQTGITVPTQPW
jgi:hypothetical protein